MKNKTEEPPQHVYLTRIVSQPFGITESTIRELREEGIRLYSDNMQVAKNPHKTEYERDQAKIIVRDALRTIQTFSAPPEDILAQAHAVYDRAKRLTEVHTESTRVAQVLLDEFPNVVDLHHLFYTQPWGTQLMDIVTSTKITRDLDKEYLKNGRYQPIHRT